MRKIIVLGIGNRLMMDDGIGIYLVEELMKHADDTDVQYIVGESDINYCLKVIEDATDVIILDAVISGNEPGELRVYSLNNLSVVHFLDLSVHNLHLFQVLYQLKESVHGYLIGITPYKIEFNIGLSKLIEKRWTYIVQNVNNVIRQLI